MDLGQLGTISFTWSFFSDLLSIILINLVLSGDNAVVIAMAVRSLPARQKRKGIAFGAAIAVLLRVALTFFVSQLLQANGVRLFGGVLILWIAVKLFVDGSPDEAARKEAGSVYQAIKLILVADITMSTDNVLALGAAAHGNLFLLLFGLALSIPFVIFTSNLLSMLMDRHPVIIYIGAAILGRVGGEMIITDSLMISWINPGIALEYGTQAAFTIAVLIVGQVLVMRKKRKESAGTAVAPSGPVAPSNRGNCRLS